MVTLLRALTHPDYTGDPVASPDIGLFTTQETLSNKLSIATDAELTDLDLGDELLLSGFPGDVQDTEHNHFQHLVHIRTKQLC